jgi:hypothetical protein
MTAKKAYTERKIPLKDYRGFKIAKLVYFSRGADKRVITYMGVKPGKSISAKDVKSLHKLIDEYLKTSFKRK